MRGLQVWSEGRKRRVGAALKGLPWVASLPGVESTGKGAAVSLLLLVTSAAQLNYRTDSPFFFNDLGCEWPVATP